MKTNPLTTTALGNLQTNFGFLCILVFKLGAGKGQTEWRMYKTTVTYCDDCMMKQNGSSMQEFHI